MTALVQYDLGDGDSVLVEVDGVDKPVTRGGGRESMVSHAAESFQEAVSHLGPAVKALVAQLRDAAEWPAEVTVEFAVKLSAESGVIIARAGGEANFKVTLRWDRKA